MSLAFDRLTPETAPEAARPLLAGSARRFGFLPSPVARAARSPALLAHLFASFAAFDASSLGEAEREVVAMTVAYEVGCHYCMALHSATLARDPALAPLAAPLRAGAPLADPRLEAVRRYARALLVGRGRPGAEESRAFEAAGYDAQAALDVALGVGVYVLSTTVNILTEAELDPAFEAFRWERPMDPG